MAAGGKRGALVIDLSLQIGSLARAALVSAFALLEPGDDGLRARAFRSSASWATTTSLRVCSILSKR